MPPYMELAYASHAQNQNQNVWPVMELKLVQKGDPGAGAGTPLVITYHPNELRTEICNQDNQQPITLC